MSANFQRFLIASAVSTLLAACDPDVVIGARWSAADSPVGGSAGLAGGGGSSAGTEASAGEPSMASGGQSSAGAPASSDAGAGGAAPPAPEWCATSPWLNTPVIFTGESGNVIPAGMYLVTYVSGAQIHETGYEVTAHYIGKNGLEAGHHIFSGSNPETAATSLWLDGTGIIGPSPTIAEVERANRGHTWPLTHVGGQLSVTLYDDDYRDNAGPGSRFCIVPAR